MSYNKFGIGIAAPADNLHVLGAVRFGDSSSSTNQARIYAGSTFSAWQTRSGTDAFIIDQTTARVGFPSSVGIGTTSPMNTATFQVRYGTNENFTIREIEGTHPQLSAVKDGFAAYIPLSIDGSPLRLNKFGGNVGIGTTDPKVKLHIYNGVANSNVYIRHSGGSNTAQVFGATDAGGYGSLAIDGTPLILNAEINSGGNVGIGTLTPSQKLHVVGNILASGTITPSDRRIKDNITPASTSMALSQIKALEVMRYSYKDKVLMSNENEVYGFIAQQVREVIPEAVSTLNMIIPNIMQYSKTYEIEKINYKPQVKDTEDVTTVSTGGFQDITAKVTLNSPHGLSITTQPKVRICNDWVDDGISDEFFEEVRVEVIDEITLRVTLSKESFKDLSRVFVYGYEVNDFHALSKDKLFTPLVAATQELDRKVVSLENELRELKELLRSKNIM